MDFFCQLLTPAAGPLAAARRCDIRQFDASVVPEQQFRSGSGKSHQAHDRVAAAVRDCML